MPDGDLYIRATSGDTGARPLPPNTVYWESPSVGLFETGSNIPLDAATAGTQYDIRVRVANKSTNAFNATVQVFAAKWGAVNPFLQSVGGAGGVPIGPQLVPGGAAGAEEVQFVTGWLPDASELGGATQLHLCLLANVFAPTDGAQLATGEIFSDIPANGHHAQHNVALNAAPMMQRAMKFPFHAGNPGKRADAFVLELVDTGARRLSRTAAAQLQAQPWFARARKQLEAPLRFLGPTPGARLVAGEREGTKLELELGGREEVPVVIVADRLGREPGIHSLSLVQRSLRTGRALGGATLLTALLPERLMPEPMRRAAAAAA